MRNAYTFALSTLAAVLALTLPANAQSVISTHSGLIHYFEGAVYLGDQPLESHLGKYPAMPQGAELRTADGRAEVLLTPGVFLRVGDHSSIRMVANDLGDTQVLLQMGAVIIDSAEPNTDTSVTLIYRNWRIHFLQKGVYRVNADPPRLWVREGKAEVFAAPAGPPVTVEHGMYLPFAAVLVPERSGAEPLDALSAWSKGRGESIDADNLITAQIDQDPASQAPGGDAFTYFPMLGLASLAPGYSLPYGGIYSPTTPNHPGFNSIYLPGYTHVPLLFGLSGGGIRSAVSSPLRQIGIPQFGLRQFGVPQTGVPRIGVPQIGVPQFGITRPGAPGAGLVPLSPGRPGRPAAGSPITLPRPTPVAPAPHPGGVHGGRR